MLTGLKYLMREKKLTQRELIERAFPGLKRDEYKKKQGQLSKWLTGRVGPSVNNESLKAYAEALEVRVGDLI